MKEISQVQNLRANTSAHRVYYYNSIDDEPRRNESEGDVKARVDAAVHRFDGIAAQSGFHVRFGTVTGRTVKKRRQKQVDVQLAVDALLHAINRNMGHAVLLAGDLDFKPLVEALVSLGVPVTVLYEKQSGAKQLYLSADDSRAFGLEDCWQWSSDDFREAHPIPVTSVGNYAAPAGPLLKEGSWQGRPLRLYQTASGNRDLYVLHVPQQGRVSGLMVQGYELGVLERFFKVIYGDYGWR